jgi:hypothetical protein
MSDPGTRPLRYPLIERLVEVASAAGEQIELLGDDGWFQELALGYVDWSILPFAKLERQGALSPDVRRSAEEARQALLLPLGRVWAGTSLLGVAVAFTEDGLRHDPK